MLSIPASFAVMYFFKWWIGLIALLVIPSTLRKANRTGVMQDVIRHAIHDRDYYLAALETGLIRIQHPSAAVGSSSSGSSGPMSDDEAMKIINAYGKTLMERKTAFGGLSALPYPKARIKEALIHGIKETDDSSFREQLKAAYVTLSEWQTGFENRGGAVGLNDDELQDPAQAAARIAADTDFLKVPQEVAAEATALRAELKALKLA